MTGWCGLTRRSRRVFETVAHRETVENVSDGPEALLLQAAQVPTEQRHGVGKCRLCGWSEMRAPGVLSDTGAAIAEDDVKRGVAAKSKHLALGDARRLAWHPLAVLRLREDEYTVRLADGVIDPREHSRIEALGAPDDRTAPLIHGAAEALQVVWAECPVEFDNATASLARKGTRTERS